MTSVAGPGSLHRLITQVSAPHLAVVGITIYVLATAVYPSILLPWYFNTEEFPYVQEVLRFSEFNFKQEFFDIPGTPLMMLGTALWWPYYLASNLLSADYQTIREFNFGHLQEMYVLLRTISIVSFLATVVLTYLVANRLIGAAGACVAASIVAIHPMLNVTLYHLRIEPLNLALVLLSVWLVLKAVESHSYYLYGASGFAAGLAMASRFPSVLAPLPVILAYALLHYHVFTDARLRSRSKTIAAVVMAVAIIGGALSLLLALAHIDANWLTHVYSISAPTGQYPAAITAIRKLWMGIGTLCLIALAALYVKVLARFFKDLFHSSLVPLLAGVFAGLLAGVPTLLWQGEYFLRSIQMFVDRNASGIWQTDTLWQTAAFFLFSIKPEDKGFKLDVAPLQQGVCISYFHIVLLAAGVLWTVHAVLRKRELALLPMLLGAFVGIVAQHGKMQSARHLVAWLPYFGILMAAPLAGLLGVRSFVRSSAAVIVAMGILGLSIKPRDLMLLPSLNHFLEKNVLMPKLDTWLAGNIGKEEMSFHVCCEPANAEVILSWMQKNGVAIPFDEATLRHTIWFGDKESLVAAGKGYIVISKHSYKGFYIDYYTKVKPESITDPFHDPHFTLRQEIESGAGSVWQVYYFDLSDPN